MERILRALPSKPQPLWLRYSATTILVALSFLLMKAVQEFTPVQGYFLLFPAIFLTAIAFDRGSGFYATALSTVLLAIWGGLPNEVEYSSEHWFSLGLFAVIGLCLAAVSEGLRVEWERVITAEKQKAILLRELRHRTKNEFALAAAILRLQAKAQASKELQTALGSAISRIETFERTHQEFDLPDSGVDIPMRPYLEGLCSSVSARASDENPVRIQVACEDIALPAKHANTIGLICNELVTNACKHAFDPGSRGNVSVTLTRSNALLSLVVADDGKGCPEDAKEGVGSQFIRLLVAQLEGDLSRQGIDKGCRVSVSIPETSLRR
jgi:two-component sensor histidine kinase